MSPSSEPDRRSSIEPAVTRSLATLLGHRLVGRQSEQTNDHRRALGLDTEQRRRSVSEREGACWAGGLALAGLLLALGLHRAAAAQAPVIAELEDADAGVAAPDHASGALAPDAGAADAVIPDVAADQQAVRLRLEQLERRLAAAEARAAPATAPPAPPIAPSVELHFGGYGDLQFAFHDFGPNQNREGGAQQDPRLVFDTTRFVLEVEGELPYDIEFEAEIEFEHGGTGAAMELEYEEFGEFEQEVEKGGEVLLEELYLKKTFAERYSVAVGRFYVAMGLLSRHYHPTDYLAAVRSEAETTAIPQVWDEMGVQVQAQWPWLRATAQVVNGLDSTGFSSQRFVASGHQSRFELVRATDLAVVGRVDVTPADDIDVGVASYYGGTSRNRPKPDLVPECNDGDPKAAAPCGYVDAPLLLLDGHGQFRLGPLRGSALVLWGHLANAGAISSRNERLSNALNVLRTPVADDALAAWAELGLDVAPWLWLGPDHRLEPFVRVDYYDTMFGVRDGLFDNPRFERTVVTAGVSYALSQHLVLKLDASHRRFGTASLNPESSVRLAAGFVY